MKNTEFVNDFSKLLSDDLKEQGLSDNEIQTKISSVKNDEEFPQLLDLQNTENTSYLAETDQQLTASATELHNITAEQEKLSEAIENYGDKNAHVQETYFASAKIPTYQAPAPVEAVAPTPSTAPTPKETSAPESSEPE